MTTGRRPDRMRAPVEGARELAALLERDYPREVNNAMRSAVQAMAQELSREIKASVPVGRTGNLKRSIQAKRGRSRPGQSPSSTVQVKPDGFYWRMVEYGRGGGKGSHVRRQYQPNAKPFVGPVLERWRTTFGPKLQQHFVKKFEAVMARKAARASARRGR